MTKTTALYIGELEIEGIKKNIVTFVDGNTVKYTPKQLECIISKEPLDESKFSEMVLNTIVKEVFETIGKYDINEVVKIV